MLSVFTAMNLRARSAAWAPISRALAYGSVVGRLTGIVPSYLTRNGRLKLGHE
jgi:hypothetical protein